MTRDEYLEQGESQKENEDLNTCFREEEYNQSLGKERYVSAIKTELTLEHARLCHEKELIEAKIEELEKIYNKIK